jgi:hypothetical protein
MCLKEQQLDSGRLFVTFLAPGGHMVGPFDDILCRVSIDANFSSGMYGIRYLARVAFAELLDGDACTSRHVEHENNNTRT